MEIEVTMSSAAYREMLELKGIGSKDRLIAYINATWGLLGTVVDIALTD